MEEGDAALIARRRAVDHRTFRQDEAHPAFCPAAVIGGIRVARHTVRRHGASHRRHDDPVGQIHRADPKGPEKYVGRITGHVRHLYLA